MDLTKDHIGYENVKNGKIYVSYEVKNFEFFYEPFYVAKDTAPAHDERFMGYGFTRNTQVLFAILFIACHIYDFFNSFM